MTPRLPNPKPPKRKLDPAYLAAVRKLPCCCPNRPCFTSRYWPVQADHAGKRALSRKADDSTAIPLTTICHNDRHNFSGAFDGWTRAKMRAWLDLKIAETRAKINPPGDNP